jgi:hypothetical protein
MVTRGTYRERGEKGARRCGDIRRIQKKEEIKPKGRNILKLFYGFDLHLQQQTSSGLNKTPSELRGGRR